MNKICSKCKIDKDIEEFTFVSNSKEKRRTHCKECISKHFQDYKIKNREKLQNIWRQSSRKYSNSDRSRIRTLARHGITIEIYDSMYDKQNGKCAICNLSIKLCVDHNHTSGKVRGLLCFHCNTALGLFKDDLKILNSAIKYLQNFDIMRDGLEMKPAKDS